MKIVVGYEGSKACLSALKLAVKYAKPYKAHVLVIGSLVGGERPLRRRSSRPRNT